METSHAIGHLYLWIIMKMKSSEVILIDNNNNSLNRVLMIKNIGKEMSHSLGPWVSTRDLHKLQVRLMTKENQWVPGIRLALILLILMLKESFTAFSVYYSLNKAWK